MQIEALTKAGCEKLFTDKASGAKTERPGLSEALHFARVGDTLVIWKLDRLGRSIRGLVELAAGLSARKIEFRSLTDGFDTATPSGRLLFHILASVAEMERELVKERTIAGLAAARAKGGADGGRKPAIMAEKIDTARKSLAARGQTGEDRQIAASRIVDVLSLLPGKRAVRRLIQLVSIDRDPCRMASRLGSAGLKDRPKALTFNASSSFQSSAVSAWPHGTSQKARSSWQA